ncbi:hypothetical protein BDN72DRAFT_306113 [Pluteus cervinus]|uniref:Uncharacterized protein n=1 Tax=Pluteus cervinus TaxID=181527 RepID=A0ACD3AED7_9AGAR|nr:hypothetical protein BDN72DRAFT_306113 [Pluteus cervinus]
MSSTSELPDKLPDYWRPLYWTTNSNRLFKRIEATLFVLLCLFAHGQPTLDGFHDKLRSKDYEKRRDQALEQIKLTTVLASFLLATTAVFLTTVPPRNDLVQHTTAVPYTAIVASFASALASVVYGTIYLIIATNTQPIWVYNTVCKTRTTVLLTHLLMGASLWLLAISILCCAFGLIIAAGMSKSTLVAFGAIFIISLTGVVIFVVCWLLWPAGLLVRVMDDKQDALLNNTSADPELGNGETSHLAVSTVPSQSSGMSAGARTL